jgi:16S rRNA (guanine1207-N2)-methyltransferase
MSDHFPFADKMPRAERLLIEATREFTPGAFLCTSVGRGQGAASIAERSQGRGVVHFLDAFAADESSGWLLEEGCPNLEVVCTPDLPTGPFELTAIPVSRNGEADLAREMLQQGYVALADGGTLVAVVDNPRDRWLKEQIETLSPRFKTQPLRGGVAYTLVNDKPLKRVRDLSCEFAFRDGEGGRLLKVFSRPGVFSHRSLDLGSRALMEAIHVDSGMRVLDIGCGSGVVSVAAASRAERVQVHGVDSNVRAVECTLRSAALNELTNITAELAHAGPAGDERSFDLVVGNPPYFSQYKIADIFVRSAHRSVKPGGIVQMVTKAPDWFVARMSQLFDDVTVEEHRGFQIVRGVGRS